MGPTPATPAQSPTMTPYPTVFNPQPVSSVNPPASLGSSPSSPAPAPEPLPNSAFPVPISSAVTPNLAIPPSSTVLPPPVSPALGHASSINADPATSPVTSIPASRPAASPNEASSVAPPFNTPDPTSPPTIVLGTQTLTFNSASAIVIASQTLSPGSTITVSDTYIFLPTSAPYIVIGTTTIPFVPLTIPTSVVPTAATNPQVSSIPASNGPVEFTFESRTYTENSLGDFIIGSQTLQPGSAVTVSGNIVSLDVTPTAVVLGTSTQALGGLIMSGLEGGPTPSVATFQGAAPTLCSGIVWGLVLGCGICLALAALAI